jgi:hypothetical protein
MSEQSAGHKAEPPVHISAEGVHPEPRKTGHRLADFSIALAAIVISLISLAVGIHHGKVQERLVAANSWPFLRWDSSNEQDERGQRFAIYITNVGVGPALLQSLVVRYQGKPVRGWFELLEQCCGVERQPKLDLPALGFFTGARPISVLPPGEKVTLISLWRVPDNPQLWERLGAARLDLEFEGCFCSILGECWKSDLRTMQPTRVAECKATADDYVEVGAGYDDVKVLPVLKGQ